MLFLAHEKYVGVAYHPDINGHSLKPTSANEILVSALLVVLNAVLFVSALFRWLFRAAGFSKGP